MKSHPLVQSDLSVLLHDTPEAYYWSGFITADGSFNKNSRLTIGLSKKDYEHLVNFCNFIKCKNIRQYKNSVMVAVQNRLILPELMRKFDLQQNKSFNPPNNLQIESDELFISFLIGFIDGDGSIGYQYGRSDVIIRIKLHSTWLEYLTNLMNRLYLITESKSGSAK